MRERAGRFDRMIQLGIGGSALGNIAFHRACGGRERVEVADNVDPERLPEIDDRTLLHVVTKSGETAETLAQFAIYVERLRKLAGERWREHVLVTTDPEKGTLREIARAEGLASFEVPPGVGGRFSFLTPVGMVSVAFAGRSPGRLVEGARRAVEAGLRPGSAALAYAVLIYRFYQAGKPMAVFWPYADSLYGAAEWWRQLLAESLGKRGRGPCPFPALGATDQHSVQQLFVEGPDDKWYTFLEVGRFRKAAPIPRLYADRPAFAYLAGRDLGDLLQAEKRGTEHAVRQAGRPVVTFRIPEVVEETFAELLYTLALSVTYAGALFGIDPYDQPGVEAGKRATFALMGRAGYEALREPIERGLAGDAALVV
jgi:glucose-6-phosphate isomerase